MRFICLICTLYLLSINFAFAQQQEVQQKQAPKWEGMNNPRAVRARPTTQTWGQPANVQKPTPTPKTQPTVTQEQKTAAPVQRTVTTTPQPTQTQPVVQQRIVTTPATPAQNYSVNQPSTVEAIEKKGPILNMETILKISYAKGNKTTWKDFDKYQYVEENDVYFTRRYPIDNGNTLLIGGASADSDPRYIYIVDDNAKIIDELKGY